MSGPVACSISSLLHHVSRHSRLIFRIIRGRPDTFLPLMEDWRSWVVDTFFFELCEFLSATFVNTLVRHCFWNRESR